MNDLTKFISPIKELRLVMIASAPPVHVPGVGATPGSKGKYVEFKNGFYKTDDETIIKWLETHAEYGNKFWKSKDEGIVLDVAKTLSAQLGTGQTLNEVINKMDADQLEKLGKLISDKAAKKIEVKETVSLVEDINESDKLKEKIKELESQLKQDSDLKDAMSDESAKEMNDNYIPTDNVQKKVRRGRKPASQQS